MEMARPIGGRRFNTLDGMILVVAIAAWLSTAPGYFANLRLGCREIYDLALQLADLAPWTVPTTRWGSWRILHIAAHNIFSPWPFLFGPLVLAILILGLRSPRPSWRELVRRSGFGACSLLGIYPLVRLEARWLGGDPVAFALDGAMAAVLLWAVLGRRPWGAEATWLDRLGRGAAGYWILVLATGAVDHALFGCFAS